MTDAGLFITLEGGDGAGKSTQASLLCDTLSSFGRAVCLVHEPGGTQVGERIRTLLLDSNIEHMNPVTELLLYEAARAQIVSELIKPALAAGKIVVCDRFSDSSVAYQGFGRQLGGSLVKRLNELTCAGCVPDRTILLKLSAEDGLRRAITGRGVDEADRMESAGMLFHERVNAAFEQLACEDSTGRIRIVDASASVNEVHSAILATLVDLIPELTSITQA